MYVDSHCHLNFPELASQLPDILARMREAGVTQALCIGTTIEEFDAVHRLALDHDHFWATVGVHPDNEDVIEPTQAELVALARRERVVAIGETGLDYYRTAEPGRPAQRDSFRAHIDLARRTGKALQIHDRDAHEDVLAILAAERAGAGGEPIVMHCFSGDMAMARECVERGYFLSFSGTVTFKGAGSLRDALAVIPLDQVLVETDAPFLTPHPHRGAANASYLIPLTVRVMAMVLNVSVPTMCEALSANAERLYGPW